MNYCCFKGKVSEIEYKLIVKHRSKSGKKIVPTHKVTDEKSICTFKLEIGGFDVNYFKKLGTIKINIVSFDQKADICFSKLRENDMCIVSGKLENYTLKKDSYVRINEIYLFPKSEN